MCMDALFSRLFGRGSSHSPAAPVDPASRAMSREPVTSKLCHDILRKATPEKVEVEVEELIENWNHLKRGRISTTLSDQIYKAACKISEIYGHTIEGPARTMLEEVFIRQLEEIERKVHTPSTDLENLTNELEALWKAMKQSDIGKIGSPLSYRVETLALNIRRLSASKTPPLSHDVNTKLILLQRANFESVVEWLRLRSNTKISEEDHKTFTEVLATYWISIGRKVEYEILAARILFAAETLNSAKTSLRFQPMISSIKEVLRGRKETTSRTPLTLAEKSTSSAPPPPSRPTTHPSSAASAAASSSIERPSRVLYGRKVPPSISTAHTDEARSSSSLGLHISTSGSTEVSGVSTPSTRGSEPASPVTAHPGERLRRETGTPSATCPIRHTFDDLLTLASEEVGEQINKSDLEGHATVINELFLNCQAYLIAAGEGISFDKLCRNFVEAYYKLSDEDRLDFRVEPKTWTIILNYAARSVIVESYQARFSSLRMPTIKAEFLATIDEKYAALLSEIRSGKDDIFDAKESAIREINTAQERLLHAQERAAQAFLRLAQPIHTSDLTAIRDEQQFLRGLLKNVINGGLRTDIESRLTSLNQSEATLIVNKAQNITTGMSQYDLVCIDLEGNPTKGAARNACAFIAAVNIEAQFNGSTLSPEEAILRGLYRQQVALRSGLLRKADSTIEEITSGMKVASLTRLEDAKKLVRQSLTPIVYHVNNITFTDEDETGLNAYNSLLRTLKNAMAEHEKIGAIIRLGEKYLSITIQGNGSGASQITIADSHGFDRGSEPSRLVEKSFQCNFTSLEDAANFLSIYYRPQPPFNEANCIEFDLYTTNPPSVSSRIGAGTGRMFPIDTAASRVIDLSGEEPFVEEHRRRFPLITPDVD